MPEITVPDNDARKQYVASAGQTVFPYDFPIFDEDHLVVQQTVALTGVTTALIITTHYTVSDVGAAGGGNVTLVTGAAVNDIITIERDVPVERTTDFLDGGDYRAESINRELDLQTMMMQQNERNIARCLQLAPEDTAISQTLPLTADRIDKILAFDSSGDPIAITNIGGISDAQVKVAYENNADTNEFDDAEQAKLAGVETAADVTDGVNVGEANAAAAAKATPVDADSIVIIDSEASDVIKKTTFTQLKAFFKPYFDTLYNALLSTVSQAEAEAGTATTDRNWTAQRVAQAIAALAAGGGLTLGTPIVTTSGTSHDFTGIPAGTKKITMTIEGISTTGTSTPMVQIGDAGGIEASGYLGSVSLASGAAQSANFTNGLKLSIDINGWGATSVAHGRVELTLLDPSTNTWALTGHLGHSSIAMSLISAGSKSLSAELTQIRLTTNGGSDTFDAGKINIVYE